MEPAAMAPSTAERARVARIAFLDDDHVMRLTRTILTAQGGDDEQWLRSFFAPERVDVDELIELGAGLRRRDGATVALAPGDGTAAGIEDANVLLFRRGRVTRELLSACPGVQLIQRLGEDPSGIDLAAAAERGIEVSCLSRRTLRHASEHVMALMLALVKQLLPADRAVRAGVGADTARPGVDGSAYNWIGLSGLAGLDGRTLGLVGCGEIGGLVARRAAAFGMRVLYNDAFRLSPAREQALGVDFRSLEALLEESDIVSVHVPGTPANAHLIGATEIARMRPDAWLINTSRGTVVDEDALYVALVEQRLAGAGLDVHDPEPRLASDRFCHLENVVLTPHVSGGSRLSVLAEIGQMYDNVRAVLAGGRAIHDRVEPAA
jgi:phosphoglycerate dehydrogenase-like enzyme